MFDQITRTSVGAGRRSVVVVLGITMLVAGGVAASPGAHAAPVHPTSLLTPADVPEVLGVSTPGVGASVSEVPASGVQVCHGVGNDWDVNVPGPSSFTIATVPTGANRDAAVSQLVYAFPGPGSARQAFALIKKVYGDCSTKQVVEQDGGTITTQISSGLVCVFAKPQNLNSCRNGRNSWVYVQTGVRYSGTPRFGDSASRLMMFSLWDNAIIVTAVWRLGAPGSNPPGFADGTIPALRDLSKALGARWEATQAP